MLCKIEDKMARYLIEQKIGRRWTVLEVLDDYVDAIRETMHFEWAYPNYEFRMVEAKARRPRPITHASERFDR
jgi:hypothetical protein